MLFFYLTHYRGYLGQKSFKKIWSLLGQRSFKKDALGRKKLWPWSYLARISGNSRRRRWMQYKNAFKISWPLLQIHIREEKFVAWVLPRQNFWQFSAAPLNAIQKCFKKSRLNIWVELLGVFKASGENYRILAKYSPLA